MERPTGYKVQVPRHYLETLADQMAEPAELAQALCSLCGATFAALGVDAIHADSGAICEIERIAANDSVY